MNKTLPNIHPREGRRPGGRGINIFVNHEEKTSQEQIQKVQQRMPTISIKNQRGQIRRLQKPSSETSPVLEEPLWTVGPRMDLFQHDGEKKVRWRPEKVPEGCGDLTSAHIHSKGTQQRPEEACWGGKPAVGDD